METATTTLPQPAQTDSSQRQSWGPSDAGDCSGEGTPQMALPSNIVKPLQAQHRQISCKEWDVESWSDESTVSVPLEAAASMRGWPQGGDAKKDGSMVWVSFQSSSFADGNHALFFAKAVSRKSKSKSSSNSDSGSVDNDSNNNSNNNNDNNSNNKPSSSLHLYLTRKQLPRSSSHSDDKLSFLDLSRSTQSYSVQERRSASPKYLDDERSLEMQDIFKVCKSGNCSASSTITSSTSMMMTMETPMDDPTTAQCAPSAWIETREPSGSINTDIEHTNIITDDDDDDEAIWNQLDAADGQHFQFIQVNGCVWDSEFDHSCPLFGDPMEVSLFDHEDHEEYQSCPSLSNDMPHQDETSVWVIPRDGEDDPPSQNRSRIESGELHAASMPKTAMPLAGPPSPNSVHDISSIQTASRSMSTRPISAPSRTPSSSAQASAPAAPASVESLLTDKRGQSMRRLSRKPRYAHSVPQAFALIAEFADGITPRASGNRTKTFDASLMSSIPTFSERGESRRRKPLRRSSFPATSRADSDGPRKLRAPSPRNDDRDALGESRHRSEHSTRCALSDEAQGATASSTSPPSTRPPASSSAARGQSTSTSSMDPLPLTGWMLRLAWKNSRSGQSPECAHSSSSGAPKPALPKQERASDPSPCMLLPPAFRATANRHRHLRRQTSLGDSPAARPAAASSFQVRCEIRAV